MPSSDEEEPPNTTGGATGTIPSSVVDADTLRIMISTDNHLGYAEKDPVRGTRTSAVVANKQEN